MPSPMAEREAEKFRVHVLTIALAAKAGKDGDLRKATEMLLGAVAKSLDDFYQRDSRLHRAATESERS